MTVAGVGAVGAAGFSPYVAPQVGADQVTVRAATTPQTPGMTAAGPATSVADAGGTSFGDLLADGVDRMEAVNDRADRLSVQAATGDLRNIHDYTIAATEASVTTQLTVAVRNKALEAFNEIMRMPV